MLAIIAGVAALGREEGVAVDLVGDLGLRGDPLVDARFHLGEAHGLPGGVPAPDAVLPRGGGRGDAEFPEEVGGEGDFPGRGGATQGQAVQGLHPLGRRGEVRRLRGQAIGQGAAERVVDHPQRLLGRGRLVAFGHVVVGVREVERPKDGREVLAIDETEDRPARCGEIGDEVERLAGRLAVESTRGAEHAVAHGFEVQAAAVHPPAQQVFRVFGQAGFVQGGGLAEGRRKDHAAEQSLHRPPIGHERG